MASNFNYNIFLSRSANDKVVVRDVAERPRKDGVKVWFDEWVLKPGDSIPARIEEGLERSRVLVLCMSANAFGSDWSQLESGTFQMQGHHALRNPLNKELRFLPLPPTGKKASYQPNFSARIAFANSSFKNS